MKTNEIENELIKTLGQYKYKTINEQLNKIYYFDIEQENKVKKIEKVKDILNTYTKLYLFNIGFGGGQMLDKYTTLCKIEIIE